MPLLFLVLAVGGVAAAYLTASAAGHIPSCMPYLTGCTSISASGRYGIAYFIFKATVIPAAALLAAYWVLCVHWLRAAGDAAVARHRIILAAGLAGAAALVVYATFLGSEGDFYRAMRRYGTVVFFGFTYLAQAMLTQRAQSVFPATPVSTATTALLLVGLVEGLILGTLVNLVDGLRWLRNVAEWHVATALAVYPALTWLAWRRTGFRVGFRAEGAAPGTAPPGPEGT